MAEKDQIVKANTDAHGIATREVLTREWTDWIDYWAVDFKREIIRRENEESGEWEERWAGDYIFENKWQSSRTKKDRSLELISVFHECKNLASLDVSTFGHQRVLYLRFSEEEQQGSVFNRIIGDSGFELRFARFLEDCNDVISYAKNHLAVHWSMASGNTQRTNSRSVSAPPTRQTVADQHTAGRPADQVRAGEAMDKRANETIYLSQLEEIQILWPGDVRALAEFILRTFEARDRIVGAGPSSSRVKSPPTLHGLAGHFAWITGMPEVRIERQFEEHGLSLDATVEWDPSPADPSGKAR